MNDFEVDKGFRKSFSSHYVFNVRAKIPYHGIKESKPQYWSALFQRNSFWVKIQAIRKDLQILWRNDEI